MINFEKRTIAPSRMQECYYASNPFFQSNYGMPNCTCYAYGRFWELLGSKPKLSLSNAENWYDYNDGYERGSVPKLGAVICYRKGNTHNSNDGAGHVAIVEEIYDDGSILISESAWKSFNFRTKKLNKNFEYGNLIFQGFIYNPRSFAQPVENSVNNLYYEIGKTYTIQVDGLNVRIGAGTNKARKLFNSLTPDGQKHAYSNGCLKKETKVTCLEIQKINNEIWIRIPSGWIAGYYNNKYYIK